MARVLHQRDFVPKQVTHSLKQIRLGYCKPSRDTLWAIFHAVEDGEVGQGRHVAAFEEAFAARIGRKYAIACASGTASLTVALAAIRGRRRRSWEPPAYMRADSFVAVPNAAFAAGFRRFAFHDIDTTPEPTGGALHIAVDVMGVPEPIGPLTLLEDFSEALGSVAPSGLQCGARGTLCAITSFFVTHLVTAGEGGAIVTDDEGFADDCRSLRDHGRWGPEPDRRLAAPGFNAKMTTIEALLAMDSLDKLDEKMEARRGNAIYLDSLLGQKWVKPGVIPHGYPIFTAKDQAERNTKLEALAAAGIEARPYFPCLPRSTWVDKYTYGIGNQWPVSEHYGEVGYYVPVHEGVSREDCERMAEIVSA